MSAAPSADAVSPPARRQPPQGKPFTRETASRAGKASAVKRAQNRLPVAPPSDAAIEDGLRRRAVSSAKDAEVLLRWLARPQAAPSGLGLEAMGEEELERLYSGLLRLAGMEPSRLEALVGAQGDGS